MVQVNALRYQPDDDLMVTDGSCNRNPIARLLIGSAIWHRPIYKAVHRTPKLEGEAIQ